MTLSVPDPTDDARRDRLADATARYLLDQDSLAPLPLRKLGIGGAARGRQALTKILDLRDELRVVRRALPAMPDFVESALERVQARVAPARQRIVRQIAHLLLVELDPDPTDTSLFEELAEVVVGLLDGEDDTPYPYHRVHEGLFDLPWPEIRRDLLWRPAFPGADPDDTYFVTRNRDMQEVRRMARTMRRRLSDAGLLGGRFATIEQFREFLPEAELRGRDSYGAPRPLPACAEHLALEDDVEFGWQRIAGCNPLALTRLVAEGDPRPGLRLPIQAWPGLEAEMEALFPVISAHFGYPGSWAEAMAAGRVFVADYSAIAAAKPAMDADPPRTFRPAVGLFASFGEDPPRLLPLGIRLEPQEQTLTPLDGAWRSAKALLQVADLVHHEMISHLLRSHLILEGVATVTARRLADEHPVRALLQAHLRSVQLNLVIGRKLLLSDGGMVDQLLPLAPGEWPKVVQAGYRQWRSEWLDLRRELAARGVDDRAALPVYPYRDDGLLLWDALLAFVRRYLALFYADDADVLADPELMDWQEELLAVYSRPFPDETGAHAEERAAGFAFRDLEGLAALVAGLLFTSGPQHAAVNFAQWDQMLFAPNMPAAAYLAAGAALPPAEDLLPSPAQVVNQMEVIALLAGRQFGRLGYYPPDELPAAGALGRHIAAVIGDLRADLAHIEAEIAARNADGSRWRPYPHLLPSRVPNSANV